MMRQLPIYLSAIASLVPASAIRGGSSQFRDLEAFPKYEVQFLNHLPLAQTDASRFQASGLESEDEWSGQSGDHGDHKSVGDGVMDSYEGTSRRTEPLELIRMALTNPGSNETNLYLCLMPSASTTLAQNAKAEIEPIKEEIDPVQSWLALSHLSGKCLYARQGWFTYAYCHDSHLRQFRSAPHAHPHPPGGYVPEEDPTYDAYTLGQAHPTVRKSRTTLPQGKVKSDTNAGGGGGGEGTGNSKSDKSSIDKHKSNHHNTQNPTTIPAVSSSLNGQSRYLVQKWSDGTRCDKTGRPRETEIQIHCSMTTNDQIYLIKELAICQYVLIIHSPHLCSLPGFRPEKIDVEPAGIQCRQVMSDEEYKAWQDGQLTGEEGVKLRPKGLEMKEYEGDLPLLAEVQEDQGPSLKDLLKIAFESKQAQLGQAKSDSSSRSQGGEGQLEEDMVFISIEQDEEGNAAMVLDTERLLDNLLRGKKADKAEEKETKEKRQENVNEDKSFVPEDDRAVIDAIKRFLGNQRTIKEEILRKKNQDEEDEVRDEL